MNFGFNPVHGEGDRAHTHFRVEATHGFHQADIAFPIRPPAAGHSPSSYEQCEQQSAGETESAFRCFQIATVMQLFSKLPLFISRQHRPSVSGPDVRFRVTNGAKAKVCISLVIQILSIDIF